MFLPYPINFRLAKYTTVGELYYYVYRSMDIAVIIIIIEKIK